jgi:cytochrome d ubiquinol oxidase subunit II
MTAQEVLADIIAVLMVTGIVAYAATAGADFGIGFWDLTAGGREKGFALRSRLERSIGLVWEANHVWLIFVLVVAWTCFSVAYSSIVSTLWVPFFIAAIGIIFRGAAFAFRGEITSPRAQQLLGGMFALSSILTPFFLGALLGGVASGRVPVGNALGDPWSSWANPTGVYFGVLAVVTGIYLAAVYTAADAQRDGERDLEDALVRRALGAGAIGGVVAVGGLAILYADSRELFDNMFSAPLPIAFVALSAVTGIVTIGAVWQRHLGFARLSSAAAVATVIYAWGSAQWPYLLPNELTINDAAASTAMLASVVVAVGIGLLVLVPGLWYLFRLQLSGRLSKGHMELAERPSIAGPRSGPGPEVSQ